MSKLITLENLSAYNAKAETIFATKKQGVYYIAGTGTTAGTWLGTHPDIKEYYDGLMVLYKIPIAGASAGVTLNINNLGPVKIYLRGSTALTTHFGVNSVIQIVYTTVSGTSKWEVADYDSNTRNTAGATNTSDKLFLIGAKTQDSYPQTYSHDTTYIGTDGCLYSNSTKVSVEGHTHDYLPLSGGTLNGALHMAENEWIWLDGISGITHSSSYAAFGFNDEGAPTILNPNGRAIAIATDDIDGNYNYYQFPDRSGTVALLDDIPTGGGSGGNQLYLHTLYLRLGSTGWLGFLIKLITPESRVLSTFRMFLDNAKYYINATPTGGVSIYTGIHKLLIYDDADEQGFIGECQFITDDLRIDYEDGIDCWDSDTYDDMYISDTVVPL